MPGAAVTATLGDTTIGPVVAGEDGIAALEVTDYGEWTLKAEHVDFLRAGTKTITVDAVQVYSVRVMPIAVPEGYTELEYIQNTGTAYINTGVVPGSIDDLAIETTINVQQWGGYLSGARYAHWFGPATSDNGSDMYLSSNSSNTQPGGVLHAKGSMINLDLSLNTDTHIVASAKNGTITVSVNEEDKGSASYTFSNSPSPFFLFHITTLEETYVRAKFQHTNLWQSGKLVRALIPVRRDSDGAVGLYDALGSISDTTNSPLYLSPNDIPFIAGPET